MRKNRIISIALAMGLAMTTFTACGSKDSVSSESDSKSSDSTEAAYTTAELAGKISICGKQLKYPITAAELGDDFKLDSYVQEGQTSSMIDLFNDNGIVCTLEYYCSPDEVNENTPIDSFLFVPNDFNRDSFSINGFTANDTLEVLEEKLGAPTSSQAGLYTYDTSDNGRLEVMELAGSIFSVSFFTKLPENSK